MGKIADNVMRVTALGLFGVAAVFVWIGVTTTVDRPEVASRDTQCAPDMAFVMSQNFVKRELRSPTTAQFPRQASATSEIGECQFRVSSHVDAQNGFGAMIRSRYSVDMQFHSGSKTWSAANLSVAE